MITHGEQTVYQFRVEGTSADFHETRLADLTCACGLDWVRHPDNFQAIDDEADQRRWALACDCGRVYYQYKLTETLYRESLDWLARWNVAPSGRMTIGLYRYDIFTAVAGDDAAQLPPPAHWDWLVWNRCWQSEEEALLVAPQGKLLLVWLCPDGAAYQALRRALLD